MAAGQFCSVPDCDRELIPPYGRGMCGLHYGRWRRNGTVDRVRKRNSCSVDDCARPAYGHGLCSLHYKRVKKTGSVELAPRPRSACAIAACDGAVVGHGWCKKHYDRWRRHGDPEARRKGEVRNGCRICAACARDLPLAEYSASARSYCRSCTNARAAVRRAASPPPLAARTERTCDRCASAFSGDGRQTRYCSPACAEANKNRANWVHLNARRARLREAYVESFDRAEIFARDGWICGLCSEPIDREAVWPDPASASLDHIIPIARGGLHERANAQASHLSCNVRKGAALTS